MSLIHADTAEVMKSELELFSIFPTQTSIEETRYAHYYPTTSLDRGGPITFNIPPTEREYIDPRKVFLYMKIRILDESGDAPPAVVRAGHDETIPDNSFVYPINYFHATCFKTVDVYMNNKNVSANDTLYGYRAYFEALLSHSKATKHEQLRMGMYYQDKKPMNDVSINLSKTDNDRSKNSGAVWRFLRTQFGKPFETIGRIHSEIFSQDKLLMGNVDLSIKFHRADQKFCLMARAADARYTISIDKALLYVCQKRISPSIREAHQLALQSKNIKYPVRKVLMKFFTRSANRSDISEPNLVNGVLPRKIVFTLVDSEGFSGSLTKNPLNLEHFDLSSIALRKNGENIPFQEIEMNHEENCAIQGYMSLLEGTGHLFKEGSLDIQPFKDFTHGFTIYCLDISQAHDSGKSFNLIEQGNISLELKLAKTSTKSITIITYHEYDSLIEIDKDGVVTYE